ncbi:hypothetical protein NDU88_002171 [Pleurodeles waltl]|uniref:Uncharacterized protein n=1 Tax=Pleurodeles waltl TaxID=8319 RepID=A0AAV7KTZ5_PLEWA|nr:hypothetical protein NDU88_002171 [Pleurodeles waltl]
MLLMPARQLCIHNGQRCATTRATSRATKRLPRIQEGSADAGKELTEEKCTPTWKYGTASRLRWLHTESGFEIAYRIKMVSKTVGGYKDDVLKVHCEEQTTPHCLEYLRYLCSRYTT